MDLRVPGHHAKSESEKLERCNEVDAEKNKPCAGADFRYCDTRVAALK